MPENSLPPSESAPTRKLSEDIAQILNAFSERKVTIGEVIGLMQTRSYSFLLILISLPFCAPVPIPGLSTPLGFVTAVIGLRLTLGQEPWLPRRLLEIQLPGALLPQILKGTKKIVGWIEFLLKPRMSFLFGLPFLANLTGLFIMASGLLLALPLPIPFTNLMPALTVILFACATLEKDGFFVLAGILMFVLTVAYFLALLLFGASLAPMLHHYFGDLFSHA